MRVHSSWMVAAAWLVLGVGLGCSTGQPVVADTEGGHRDVADVSCTGTTVACGGACTTLASDPANCGTCGNVCATGDTCNAGVCAPMCASTQSLCASGDAGATCSTLATDVHNCGACGHDCGANAVCSGGVCAVSCMGTTTTCMTTGADGGTSRYCSDLTSDPANCGACGNACTTGYGCTAGSCQISCSELLRGCPATVSDGGVSDASIDAQGDGSTPPSTGGNEVCVNTDTDSNNCGGCGIVCPFGQVCSGGACATVCGTGFATCAGLCRNLQTDPMACGACGNICPAGDACVMGACVVSCGGSQVVCSGTCTNLQTDNANCGACGTVCPAGQICGAGVCATTCGTGLTTCGTGATAFCANTQVDPANCGACGTTCALPGTATDGCLMGMCTIVHCNAGVGDCDGLASNGCETDLTTTTADCGACGNACVLANATATCASSTCAIGMCNPGFADCNRTASDGCEVSTNTDNTNCGTCGNTCAAGTVCAAGVCGTTCGGGLATCPASAMASPYCANTQVDPSNCGLCGVVCSLPNAATDGCTMGSCTVATCIAGSGDCDGIESNGCETNLNTTLADCGACGAVCVLANAVSNCNSGSCSIAACNSGFADCDASPADGCEVSLRTDNANCGGCGHACIAGQVCSAGVCGTTCAASLATCPAVGSTPSYCANTSVDPANCGSCGHVCALANVATDGCTAGACSVVACVTGFGNCDGVASNGCETNVQTSTANCGVCGAVCALAHVTTQSCVTGACVIPAGACATGHADCDGIASDGCEVSTQTDNTNCGACGNACLAGQSCTAGVCAVTCATPNTICGTGAGAFCTDLQVDPADCGSCGHACALAHVTVDGCTAGACTVVTCQANWGDCDGVASNGCETNLTDTATACGTCGHPCVLANATSTCTASACGITTCNTGFADCDHTAADGCEVDTLIDNANCGACGHACGSGQVCAGGVCGATCAAPLTTCGTGATAYCSLTTSDPNNCGSCGHVCALPNVGVNGCIGGTCTIVGCTAGFADCDGVASNGCETGTVSNNNDCGTCGHVCALGQMCTGSTCVANPIVVGCSDGVREGFLSIAAYPSIASCAGGWSIPGVLGTTTPACGGIAGNNSTNPNGTGCNVADLCATGWHVCSTSANVAANTSTGCTNAAPAAGQFFTTRQSSTGCAVCATGSSLANPPCDSSSCATGCAQTSATSNDIFGCGSVGNTPDTSCAPLTFTGGDECGSLPATWHCGTDGYSEAANVTLSSPTGGGVMCCRL